MSFAVGDRVVVREYTRYPDMGGYYGHVVETHYDVSEMVSVSLRGRINGRAVDEVNLDAGNDPWPFYDEELQHVD